MFTHKIKLFQVFGIAIQIDLSWLIIAVLVAWSLAKGLFPEFYPGLSPASYWWMGVIGAAGLFISIVLHELSHALTAQNNGLPMHSITLFVFGGVAEMSEEPPNARTEFLVAIAGPIASILIAAVAYGVSRWGVASGWPVTVTGVFWYLALINGLLVAFNLIPAFPLDGGRVLRSILWHAKGNLKWATRVCSTIGSGFGLVLIVLGVLSFISGNVIGGVWWFVLGMFLRGAAQASYQQMLVRKALQGESIHRFMRDDVQTVPPSMSIEELVDDYVYRQHHKMYPVVEDGTLRGCVTTRRLSEIPRGEWRQHRVEELVEPASQNNTIRADADASEALNKMSQGGNTRLMVVDNSHLRGIVTLKDLLGFIAAKTELEGDEEDRRMVGGLRE